MPEAKKVNAEKNSSIGELNSKKTELHSFSNLPNNWPKPPESDGLYQFMAHKGQTFWKPVEWPENQPKPVQPKRKMLFVLMGQSNMQSANLGPKKIEDAPHPRVFQYSRGLNNGYNGGKEKTWIQAQDPLQHPVQHHPESIGLGLTFAKEVLKHSGPNDEVYLLCCAVGGTGFTPFGFFPNQKYTWDVNQPHNPPYMINLFKQALDDTNNILKQHPDLQLEAILWHQGENDASMSNVQYSNHLSNLVKEFRDKVKTMDKNILFVCGTMMESWRNMHPTKAAGVDFSHKSIKNYIWLSECSNNDGIKNPVSDNLAPNDNIHFSASSQREMGKRMSKAYLKVKQEKELAIENWKARQKL